MEDIYVIGVGMTPFGRHLDKDMKTLTREATTAALMDAAPARREAVVRDPELLKRISI